VNDLDEPVVGYAMYGGLGCACSTDGSETGIVRDQKELQVEKGREGVTMNKKSTMICKRTAVIVNWVVEGGRRSKQIDRRV
jgi:hypothetical protein